MTSDCFSPQNLGYTEFSRVVHENASEQRIPISGSLEITMRCNLRCQHCYIPLTQRGGLRSSEMSFPQIQRILSEISAAGCLWLLITGGEPLLRPDFKDIYLDAKQKGFIISLFTNGTLLTTDIVAMLAEQRPFAIEISLYGASEGTYELVTGIPGSFKRCMDGIAMLLAKRLPLKLKSVLLSINKHELSQMKQITEGFGLEYHFDPVIMAGIDGNLGPISYRLSPEEIVAIERADEDRARAWPREIKSRQELPVTSNKMYTCGAGRTGFHIDAFGRLSMCMTGRKPSYDLLSGSFKEGWDVWLPEVLKQEYDPDFACIHCNLRGVCSQCPAMGIIETGNPQEIVPFLCELAKLRHIAFDNQ